MVPQLQYVVMWCGLGMYLLIVVVIVNSVMLIAWLVNAVRHFSMSPSENVI